MDLGLVDVGHFSVRGDRVRIAVGRRVGRGHVLLQPRRGHPRYVDSPLARIVVLSFPHPTGKNKTVPLTKWLRGTSTILAKFKPRNCGGVIMSHSGRPMILPLKVRSSELRNIFLSAVFSNYPYNKIAGKTNFSKQFIFLGFYVRNFLIGEMNFSRKLIFSGFWVRIFLIGRLKIPSVLTNFNAFEPPKLQNSVAIL